MQFEIQTASEMQLETKGNWLHEGGGRQGGMVVNDGGRIFNCKSQQKEKRNKKKYK